MMNPRDARRTLLRSLALAGAWPLVHESARAASAAPACVLSPAMTEGPFFVDRMLQRADLTAGSRDPAVLQGVPMDLELQAVDVRAGCRPLPGLQVDVWHTDALGRYSGVEGQAGETFCRGFQVTDGNGRVAFRTVYPGWYPGRTIHVHVKVRRYEAEGRRARDFTTQIFFDDVLNDRIMTNAPYDRRGSRRTRNANDGIFGEATRLVADAAVVPGSSARVRAALTLGLILSA